MPAKSEKIPPPIPKIDQFDALVQKPLKFITDTLGIKMMKPKPDLTAIGQEMAKAKKPAEFFLTLDGDKFGLEVRVPGAKPHILSQTNLAVEKDNDVHFEILRALVNSTKLFTQAELDEWNKKHLTKAQVSFYHDSVAEYQNKVDALKKVTQALANPTYEHLDPAISSDFHDWAKGHSTLHYVTFLEDIDAKADPKTIYQKYIKDGADAPVNLGGQISGDIAKAIAANQPPDFTAARKRILTVVNTALLSKFKNEKLPAYKKELDHDSQYLESIKKILKDAGES